MTGKQVSETELMLPALYFIVRCALLIFMKYTAREEEDTSRSITKNRFFDTKSKI